MLMLTPNEVARRTGLSRRTVMRSVTRGELVAIRSNTGWSIEEADYEAWASAHALPNGQISPMPTTLPTPETTILQERILGLESLLAAMQAANDDLRADRDAWRSMAQRPWWKRLGIAVKV